MGAGSGRTGIYFPLRSNAHSLLTGAPLRSLLRRLKVAALLHDNVYLEAGEWTARSGPAGSISFWNRRQLIPGWQTPRERGQAVGKQFHLAIQREGGANAPLVPLVVSTAEVSWRASFHPLVPRLPRLRW